MRVKYTPLIERLPEAPFLDERWPSGLKSLLLAKLWAPGVLVVLQKRLPSDELLAPELRSLGVPAGPPEELGAGGVALLGEGEDLRPVRALRLAKGVRLDPEELLRALLDAGYERVEEVELPGQVARRGGVLDVFPLSEDLPLRIEFVGRRVESVRRFSPLTQRTVERVPEAWLSGVGPRAKFKEIIQVEQRPESPWELHVEPNPPFKGQISLFLEKIKEFASRGYEVWFFTTEEWRAERMREVAPVKVARGELHQGFVIPDLRLAVFSSAEVAEPERHLGAPKPIEGFEEGDLVVHRDFGIARYRGLELVETTGGKVECMRLEYADGVLFVPPEAAGRVEKYVGPPGYTPPLSRLARPQAWLQKKRRAAEEAAKIARQLLYSAAMRKARRGFAFPPDDELVRAVELGFPHPETPDQRRAIEEVKRDMEAPKVMERLVVGEVGFGKTEVILRAAAKAVSAGKQVAVLVPTTLLALQHYKTFKERLRDLPVRVEMVSRLVPPAKVKEILRDLRRGKVDIVIGTHRLLRPDVGFFDLGLLVIDEEHRFGVRQKERLKRLSLTVDTLLVTATPIPRTLSLALGKALSISQIDTPPVGRLPVKTVVAPYSPEIVYKAVKQELGRGGQVFYVHNRIQALGDIEARLREMFPEARIAVAHGKVPKSRLEKVFVEFYEGKIDILVSTAIIEAGVDFPDANTIIVERAELFGLAELHQLRGRVGRSDRQAYAYFLTGPELSERARARLEALLRYHQLGSGLKIALADLAIRGVGELLGLRQHGRARGVGYATFFTLLEEAVAKLTGEERRKAELEIAASAYLPESYVPDRALRLNYYSRLAEARAMAQVDELEEELRDRFGPLPPEAEALLNAHRARIWASGKGYSRVRFKGDEVEVLAKLGWETWPLAEVLKEVLL